MNFTSQHKKRYMTTLYGREPFRKVSYNEHISPIASFGKYACHTLTIYEIYSVMATP